MSLHGLMSSKTLTGTLCIALPGRFDVGYMFARVQSAVNISLLADGFFFILYLKTVFFLFIKTPRDLFNK